MRDRLSWMVLVLAATFICAMPGRSLRGERRMLHEGLAHLRSGAEREWTSFPERADGRTLTVRFSAKQNASPQTLGLRRIDVKHGWRALLNGKQLGRLFSDENDMEEVWELPAGALRDGENVFQVEPTDSRGDDIRIGQVWLDDRSRQEALGEGRLELTAVESSGRPLPCRFTIVGADGALAALGDTSSDTLAIRSGVAYSSVGKATIHVAAGDYRVYCGRGFEYDLPYAELSVPAGGKTAHAFTLRRVVDTKGLAACDTHVHTFEISRHGDASLAERMVTLAGEGVELAIATDHNVFVDYRPFLRKLGVAEYITPAIGNEVTTKFGHFNVFPAASAKTPLPNHKAPNWNDLFASIYGTPNVRVAIMNHPRDVHSGYTPLGPENMIAAVGERLDGRVLKANAMELINSAALQSDPMVVFHDWLTMANRGMRITAVGSSDSHEVSRKIVGQGRSYVYVDDSNPGAIDVDEAVQSFVEGKVLVSLGLLTELTVNETSRSGDTFTADNDLNVRIRVQGPAWTQASEVELYVNGQRIRSHAIPAEMQSREGVKADIQWRFPKPKFDVQMVALARGPGVTGLHWPIAKAYQPTSRTWRPYVFGASGVVRIEADGDGEWTPAMTYAERAVSKSGGDFARLVEMLAPYDVPTAAFAANTWSKSGKPLRSESVQNALDKAPPHVRKGVTRFLESQRESVLAQSMESK